MSYSLRPMPTLPSSLSTMTARIFFRKRTAISSSPVARPSLSSRVIKQLPLLALTSRASSKQDGLITLHLDSSRFLLSAFSTRLLVSAWVGVFTLGGVAHLLCWIALYPFRLFLICIILFFLSTRQRCNFESHEDSFIVFLYESARISLSKAVISDQGVSAALGPDKNQ